MLKYTGGYLDEKLAWLTTWATQHEGWINNLMDGLLIALLLLALIQIFKRLSLGWGLFTSGISRGIDSFADGVRSVLEWPKRRKMRREKKNKQDNEIAANLEDFFETKIKEGEWEPETVQKYRRKLGLIIRCMKPKRDLKGSIKARIASMRAKKAPTIPGAPAPAVDPTDEAANKVFGLDDKKKKTA